MNQLTLDFTARKENNAFSQKILENNKTKINNQCKIVLDALQRGEKLTTTSALLKYGVGDLRRRIKDLKDNLHIPVRDEILENRFKVWYL